MQMTNRNSRLLRPGSAALKRTSRNHGRRRPGRGHGPGPRYPYLRAYRWGYIHFTINSSTGQLTTVGALDSDTQATYTVTVSVRDNKDDQGAPDTAEDDSITVSITVTDVNETPVVTGVASLSSLRTATGQWLCTTRTTPENGSIIWSLSGTHADDMDISGGTLYFNDPPNHEEQETYNVIVQAFDGNSTGTLAVVVTVTDVNEDPEFSDTTTTRTVEENSGANAIVGLPVAAEDPDSSDTLTYILSGTGAGRSPSPRTARSRRSPAWTGIPRIRTT